MSFSYLYFSESSINNNQLKKNNQQPVNNNKIKRFKIKLIFNLILHLGPLTHTLNTATKTKVKQVTDTRGCKHTLNSKYLM